MKITTQTICAGYRWMYFPASPQFAVACAYEATRNIESLGACAGLPPRLIADAYLMGGEL